MRRLPTVLLLVLIAAAAVWTLIDRTRVADAGADPWTALPATSVVVIEVPRAVEAWDRWTHGAQLWNALGDLEASRTLDSMMQRLAALGGLQELRATTALFALVRTSGSTSGVLAVWPAPADADLTALYATVFRMDAMALADMARNSNATCVPVAQAPPLYVARREGLLLVASNATTLEESLLTLLAPGAAQEDTLLTQARRSFGTGVDAHVIVRTRAAAGLLGSRLEAHAADALEWPDGLAALDVRVRPEALMMSGVLLERRPSELSHVLAAQGSDVLFPSRVLPASVTLMEVRQFRTLSSDSLPAGAAGRLAALFHGQALVATAPTADGSARQWTVLRMTDAADASAALTGLCQEGAPCDSLRHRGILMLRPAGNPWPGLFRVEVGGQLERPWAAMLTDKLVLTNDVEALREAVDSWSDGMSMAEDGHIAAFLQDFGTEASLSWWCDVARSRSAIRQWCDSTWRGQLDREGSAVDGLGGALVQLSTDARGTLLLSACLQHAPRAEAPVKALWTAEFGEAPSAGPFLLRNHTNGTREVLMQDAHNRITLLSGNGQVLWTRELEGRILGDVHQVDRFRNGKLQVLFNTAEKLHLIDRNGQDVEGFPVKPGAILTAPLSVFDYEGRRDYRVLLLLDDGRIANYGLDGKAVQGWAPTKLKAACRHPVQHVRTRGQDHLLILPGDGVPVVLDRRGNVRYKAALRLPGIRTRLAVRQGTDIGNTRVIWSDTTGAVYNGTLSGTIDTMAPPGTAVGLAAVMDLDSDGRDEVLVVQGDSLVAWSAGTSRLLRGFGTPVASGPVVFELGRDEFIAVGVHRRDRLHLLDAGGQDIGMGPFTGALGCAMAEPSPTDGVDLVTRAPGGRLIAWSLAGR